MTNQLEIFDAPCLAPEAVHPFAPFPQNYLTGPIPRHFKNQTITGLTAKLTRLSEDEAATLVDFGSVWLDDRPCFDPDRSLANYQSFRINPPAYGPVKFYEADSARIVYEDEDLLVYNKESGRPSQGVPHDGYNNVLSALSRLLHGRGGGHDLWLLHRLDADTSGLLMLAKNKEAAGAMGRDFQRGQVAKEYLCVGLGSGPKGDFAVDTPIAKEGRRYVTRPGLQGLAARTSFSPLEHSELKEGSPAWLNPAVFNMADYVDGIAGRAIARRSEATRIEDEQLHAKQKSHYLLCKENLAEAAQPITRIVLFRAIPHTGRTHQIRLHLTFAGWPIGGDRFYGLGPERDPFSRLMLASSRLAFNHPRTGRVVTINLKG